MFNIDKQLKDVRLQDVQDGFKFQGQIANVIKWYIIGLYMNNDKLELEKMNELFNKNGSLYDKRAYKSEARLVFENLQSGAISIGKTLAELADLKAEQLDELPSVGVLYKGIPKKQSSKPKADKTDLKAAKQVLADNEGNFQGLTRPSDIVATAAAGIPAFKEALDQAKAMIERQVILKEFPDVTADNLDKIKVAMGEYLSELHANFPQDFEEVMLMAMSLEQPQEDLQEVA